MKRSETLCCLMMAIFLCPSAVLSQSLVKDIEIGVESSRPRAFVASENQLYFQATTAEFGTELWVTDGTEEGTRMVVDLAEGIASSRAEPLVVSGNTLYFNTVEPAAFWKTDGTITGTTKLAEMGSGFARRAWAVGDRVYFKYSPVNGAQLWSTDGTVNNTARVAREPGLQGLGMFTDALVFNESLYLVASGENNVHEGALWKIDPETWRPEIVLPSDSTFAHGLTSSEDQLFLLGVGSSSRSYHALWASDGTPSGTRFVTEYDGGTHGSDSAFMGSIEGSVVFSANDGIHGFEPWISDGTVAGTRLLYDLNPGPGDSIRFDGVELNRYLYFSISTQENGSELWRYSANDRKLELFKDIASGPLGSSVSDLFTTNNRLYFSANNGANGSELWVSSGRNSETSMLADINPGLDDSSPSDFAVFQGSLYFSAIHSETGRELWKHDLNSISVSNSVPTASPRRDLLIEIFPNPSSAQTTLKYSSDSGPLGISIFDILGRETKIVTTGIPTQGVYQHTFDASTLASGLYLVRIQNNELSQVKKLVINH